METVLSFIFWFVIFWFISKMIMRLLDSGATQKKDKELKAMSKVIHETLYVIHEEVPYNDEKVFLGLSAIEKKFLGQGLTLNDMFKTIFTRFPNKKVIVYFPNGEKTKESDKPITIYRNKIFA